MTGAGFVPGREWAYIWAMAKNHPYRAGAAPCAGALAGLFRTEATPRRLPALAGWALFLDLDGTLLDLAATPDAVRLAEGLATTLAALERVTGGALAIVTGRSVAFVDGLLPGPRLAVAGLHGAEIRPAAAPPPLPPPAGHDATFAAARDWARAMARPLPGVLFEDKARAFALHYRQAPAQHPAVARIMAAAQRMAGPGHLLRTGKCVVELGPSGIDKGSAVRNLMAAHPFQGRYPVAAGDDLTDEAMFRAVNALGGLSLRVGPAEALAHSAAVAGLATPAAFRAWLGGLVE